MKEFTMTLEWRNIKSNVLHSSLRQLLYSFTLAHSFCFLDYIIFFKKKKYSHFYLTSVRNLSLACYFTWVHNAATHYSHSLNIIQALFFFFQNRITDFLTDIVGVFHKPHSTYCHKNSSAGYLVRPSLRAKIVC